MIYMKLFLICDGYVFIDCLGVFRYLLVCRLKCCLYSGDVIMMCLLRLLISLCDIMVVCDMGLMLLIVNMLLLVCVM